MVFFLLQAYDSFVLSLSQHFLLFPFCFYTTDINECSSPRACQLNERCVNTVGSYACRRLISCPQGYRVNNDICEGTWEPLSATERWASGYGHCPRNPSRDCMTAQSLPAAFRERRPLRSQQTCHFTRDHAVER